MSRINVVDPAAANGDAKVLLDGVQDALGAVPNFIRVLANSPVALKGFLGLHEIAGQGDLNPQTRERIALAVAQQNSCEYCVSAHTAIGRKSGLEPAEILANRRASSADAKAGAALVFAKALVDDLGAVSDRDFATVRAAGHSDAEIVEIIAHVALNIFTNLVAKATQVEIDFPKIDLQQAA